MIRLRLAGGVLTLVVAAGGCAAEGTDAAPAPVASTAAPPRPFNDLPLAPSVIGDLPGSPILEGLLLPAGSRGGAPAPTDICAAFTVTAALFDDNSPDVRSDAAADVDVLARRLATEPGTVDILGHTDPRPTTFPGGNDGLSMARATSVRDALVSNRDDPLDPSRLGEVDGRGSENLVDLGDSEEALRKNRRVEVLVHCPLAGTPGGRRQVQVP